MSTALYECDGGFIMVPWDQFEEGVEWYRIHMGWKLADQIMTPVGKKAFFRLPGGGQTTLKSFQADYEHFKETERYDGHYRFCFRTGNFDDAQAYFQSIDQRVSEPMLLPHGQRAFDLYAFADARLTVVEDSAFTGQYPESRTVKYAAKMLWLGVRDLEQSISWYSKYLGFLHSDTPVDNPDFALLKVKPSYMDEWIDTIWLQQNGNISGQQISSAGRPYFMIRGREQFDQAHRDLQEQGLNPTDVAGSAKGWAGFHFYDPDGNQINVWTY